MKNFIISIFAIAICLFGGKSYCADWKYYGDFLRSEGVDELLFYDASNITDSNNSIKLWVKSILLSNIEKLLKDKSLNDNVNAKIASGYKAPITKIYPEATNAAYLEEAANNVTVKSSSEILYQIACVDRRIRKITGKAFHPDGKLNLGFGISKWERIESRSNADNLANILCSPK